MAPLSVLAYVLVSMGVIIAFLLAAFVIGWSAARAPLRTARRRVTYRAALTSGPESSATGTSSGAREAAMAAFELAIASDADVDDGASSWPTVPTLRQRSSTYRRSRKAGLKVHRDVYGRIVDSAATLARSASPCTRRWSTIAHDRTSRGKSDQAICKRMNKLRMSPLLRGRSST
jgi:predicted secreted Zn-dependent protease